MKNAEAVLIGIVRDGLKSLSAKIGNLEQQRIFTSFLIALAALISIILYFFDSSGWVLFAVCGGLGAFGWLHNYDRDRDMQRQSIETEDRLRAAGYGVRWNSKTSDVEIFKQQ